MSVTTAKAQIGEHRDEFAVGVSGGYVMSSINFQPEVPQNQLGGMIGGLTFRYTTEKYFSSVCAIVGEVNYAQIGWKQRSTSVASTTFRCLSWLDWGGDVNAMACSSSSRLDRNWDFS